MLHLFFSIWLATRKRYNSRSRLLLTTVIITCQNTWDIRCVSIRNLRLTVSGISFNRLTFRFFLRIGREPWPLRLWNDVTGWRNLFLCLSCAIFQDPLPGIDLLYRQFGVKALISLDFGHFDVISIIYKSRRGRVLPYISHTALCRPKGYSFCTVLVWKRI